jgi:hypothetical protein
VSGTYGTHDSYPSNKTIDLSCDEEISDGNKHPWCDIDFTDDLMSEF